MIAECLKGFYAREKFEGTSFSTLINTEIIFLFLLWNTFKNIIIDLSRRMASFESLSYFRNNLENYVLKKYIRNN